MPNAQRPTYDSIFAQQHVSLCRDVSLVHCQPVRGKPRCRCVPPLWYSSSESSPFCLAAFSFRSTVETPEDGRTSSSSSSDASDWVLPIPKI
jgi:hypothetical protein